MVVPLSPLAGCPSALWDISVAPTLPFPSRLSSFGYRRRLSPFGYPPFLVVSANLAAWVDIVQIVPFVSSLIANCWVQYVFGETTRVEWTYGSSGWYLVGVTVGVTFVYLMVWGRSG